jgi:hypothetical protein
MATTVQSDFVDVQLSAAGVAMVGADGALQIANAHLSYKFTPGTVTRVLTSEWSKVLSRETFGGDPIFEPAPAAAAAQTTSRAKSSQDAGKTNDTTTDAQTETAASKGSK